jgi:molecular chaperone IbpA
MYSLNKGETSMSNLLQVFDQKFFDNLHRTTIGFDRLFDDVLRVNSINVQQNYPPYNIIRNDETNYEIQIAISGFSEKDIDITLTDNQLVITGENTDEDTRDWVYRGIASRKFIRTFALSDDVVVKAAKVKNGLLIVELEHIIPDEKKPKKIPVISD